MKKWIMSSFLIILMVIITCTAGAKPAVQSESDMMKHGVLFSCIKEQYTEAESGKVIKPWVSFTVQEPTTHLLTLEMKNDNDKSINLYLEYNNYLVGLYDNHQENEPNAEIISATQLSLIDNTEYIAIAGDEGLYLWWEHGEAFLPYNNCTPLKNTGTTFYNGLFMHLYCTDIRCHTNDINAKASSSRGDTLYATTSGFQFELNSHHNTNIIVPVIIVSLGVLFLGSMIILLRLKSKTIFKKKKKKRRIRKKRSETHHKKSTQEDDTQNVDSESYASNITDIEEDGFDEVDESYIDNSEEMPKYDDFPSVIEPVIDLMPLYTTIAEYLRARPYMQSYNLDSNQIITYMKSREKTLSNVRLLPSEERNSIFLLLNDTTLLVNPMWMNSWNHPKLKIDSLWYKANTVEYVYEIRLSNNTVIDIDEASGKTVYEIIPPEAKFAGETIVVIKKGILYV